MAQEVEGLLMVGIGVRKARNAPSLALMWIVNGNTALGQLQPIFRRLWGPQLATSARRRCGLANVWPLIIERAGGLAMGL
jgi:hypothetical protein